MRVLLIFKFSLENDTFPLERIVKDVDMAPMRGSSFGNGYCYCRRLRHLQGWLEMIFHFSPFLTMKFDAWFRVALLSFWALGQVSSHVLETKWAIKVWNKILKLILNLNYFFLSRQLTRQSKIFGFMYPTEKKIPDGVFVIFRFQFWQLFFTHI